MEATNRSNEEPLTRSPRWHRRKESRPAEILAAAVQEFVEKGYSATRLDDVARRAGVTKGTMYLYFENKEALFKEMVRHHIAPEIERGEQIALHPPDDTRELVRRLFQHWRERLIEPPTVGGIGKLVLAEAVNFPDVTAYFYREVIDRNRAILAAAIQRGIERGEFRKVDVPLTASLGLFPVMMLAQWRHSLLRVVPEALDVPAFLEAHVTQFLRDLEPATEVVDRA